MDCVTRPVDGPHYRPTPYLAKIIIDELIFKNNPSSEVQSVAGFFGISDTVIMIALLVGLGVFMKLFASAINGWQSNFILRITRNGLYETRLRAALRVIGASQRFLREWSRHASLPA